MQHEAWNGKIAVVTGAASGIGLALACALVQRGARVHLTDIDGEAAARAAATLGTAATPQQLDVRDAKAFRELIDAVVREDSRIDYLFNNAGVAVGGAAHEIAVEHYDRLIDINIRGVVNGVAAAYPAMVRQRRGHIVNMASLAGLLPVPLMTAYTMTKHAIVGLSTSLRLEGARYGVQVSVVCPASVDTALIDRRPPSDLPPIPWHPDLRRYLARCAGPPVSPDALAAEALRGVERNTAVIVIPARARLSARIHRILPGLAELATRQALEAMLRERPNA